MADLEFFDMHLSIGRPRGPQFHIAPDIKTLKDELVPLGITGGLVKHSLSLEAHPSIGNAEIVSDLAGSADFMPVWAVLPHWTGEFPAPEELVRQMARSHVRAVVMYPAQHSFSLRDSVVGRLFDMLARLKVVLLLPQPQAAFAAVEELSRHWPSLPVVLIDVGHTMARELYPTLAACPNVYVETSTYMVHRGIEDLCAKFGPQRLLFGSRYPYYNPGAAVAALQYARIPDQAKTLIASGNANVLLGEVKL